MNIICDLDGTLVDTRKAVGAAYFHAGVEMPEGVWGKPWTDWLPQLLDSNAKAIEAHHVKSTVYPDMLKVYGKPTPLGMCMTASDAASVTLLTGASAQGAKAALALLGLEGEDFANARYGLTINDKIEHIVQAALHNVAGIYYDDDLTTCERVRAALNDIGSSWIVCHVR